MTERYNLAHLQRALIARNHAKLADLQKRLERQRAKHGPTVRILHQMESHASRALYLEAGGNPFDRRFVRSTLKGGAL